MAGEWHEHGLSYPPALGLHPPSLPAHPAVPGARILSAAQFAVLHRRHSVAHAPDGVLFPFLHGLEGDNVAQNTFFAGSEGRGGGSFNTKSVRRAAPPRFRGLVWAVAEEDLLPAAGDGEAGAQGRTDEELYRELDGEGEGDEYEDESDEGESSGEGEGEDELGMDVDVDVDVRIAMAGDELDPPIATLEDAHAPQDGQQDEEGKQIHMHPVAHRQIGLATPREDDGFAAVSGGDVVMLVDDNG
ncbi:hypothetical protein C8R46DRAFT_1042062 [Mycena filopes]|nr:hypothetical protein C8R46DRAFT_1042062 [Mycena filopes]